MSNKKHITITIEGLPNTGKTMIMGKIAQLLADAGVDSQIVDGDGDFGEFSKWGKAGHSLPSLQEVMERANVEITLIEKHSPQPWPIKPYNIGSDTPIFDRALELGHRYAILMVPDETDCIELRNRIVSAVGFNDDGPVYVDTLTQGVAINCGRAPGLNFLIWPIKKDSLFKEVLRDGLVAKYMFLAQSCMFYISENALIPLRDIKLNSRVSSSLSKWVRRVQCQTNPWTDSTWMATLLDDLSSPEEFKRDFFNAWTTSPSTGSDYHDEETKAKIRSSVPTAFIHSHEHRDRLEVKARNRAGLRDPEEIRDALRNSGLHHPNDDEPEPKNPPKNK